MIRSFLTWLLPRPLRVFLRDKMDYWIISCARDVIHRRAPNDRDKYLGVGCLDYQAHLISLLRYGYRACPTIDYAKVRNVLPNSGPLPMRRDFSSACEIAAAIQDSNKRNQEIDGFEGCAPDDAVFDEVAESWELWSHARLAGLVASFGYANYSNPSVLDLGCGPAHLFFFLGRYGIANYMGIDGNPFMLEFNRGLRGQEHHFLILNLQQEIALYQGNEPLKFDIVCSFEVLEHIREDKIDNFIRTVRNHMHARSVAFCTASLQTQIDIHVLVRDREWWLERFARFGLLPRADDAKLCRQLGLNHPFNWDPGNTNIFALKLGDSR